MNAQHIARSTAFASHKARLLTAVLVAPAIPVAVALGISGCGQGFEAVSVYPPMVYEDESALVYIYGHGFEPGATAAISWVDVQGESHNVAIENLELLDEYTLRGTLPNLEGQLSYPIYPYKEFVFLSDTYTPGLYDCPQEASETPAPTLWEQGSTGPYCDAGGGALSYALGDAEEPLIPPGSSDDLLALASERQDDYTAWYDLLDFCAAIISPDTSLTQTHLSFLIPDYGLGCFYPAGDVDARGHPNTYTYCPMKLPAVETNVVVTLPGGDRSEIENGLTFLSWELDYYYNPNFGTRIKGFYDEPDPLEPGASGSSMMLADFNQDDVTDLLSLSSYDGTIYVFAGPSLELAGAITPELPNVSWMGAANLDNDASSPSARLDLILANDITDEETQLTTSQISFHFDLLTAFPDGPLSQLTAESVVVPLDIRISDAAIADLDGDGQRDLVVAGLDPVSSQGKVFTLTQDPKAPRTFTLSDAFSIGTFPVYVAVGPLNRDTAVDIVTTNADPGAITVWYNDGTGSFSDTDVKPIEIDGTSGPIAMHQPSSSSEAVDTPQLIDLTGDGREDIAFTNLDAPQVLVCTEDEEEVRLAQVSTIDLYTYADAITVGYADIDRYPDLIVGDADGYLSVYTFSEADGFSWHWDTPATPGFQSLTSQDFDGDSDYDVAATIADGGAADVFYNRDLSIADYFYDVLYYCTY